jgi:ATP-dependent Lhr-like helicase
VKAQPPWNDWLSALAKQKRVTRLDLPRGRVWIAAERLPQFRALWPTAEVEPAVAAPPEYQGAEWSPDTALVEILRGRLEGLGPVTQEALAAPLALTPGEIAAALIALETEGFAMRGRFTSSTATEEAATEEAATEEWCERRLLARIHQSTVRRLRAEIEPVAARDYLRFLLDWQRVTAETRMEGPRAVEEIVGQLEGFEAPAAAWESEILPARIAGYDPAWLDRCCLSGQLTWARLRPRQPRPDGAPGRVAPLRTTPITLLARRHLPMWGALSASGDAAVASGRAKVVADWIRQNGASFFDELMEGTGLLRSQLEEALAELVALGLASSDSFTGLRALLVPSEQRKLSAGGRRRRSTVSFGVEDAGRWTLAQARPTRVAGRDPVEHVARALLSRYGVVFWRLLEREADWLPPWRDLLRVYRRLEGRGEIRGGRFVAGFAGEQFALPQAVAALREMRRKPASGAWVSLSAADPLNLIGILTPGMRLPALTGNRLLYCDGLPVATLAGGETQLLEDMDPRTEWEARKALLRALPSPPISPAPAIGRARLARLNGAVGRGAS